MNRHERQMQAQLEALANGALSPTATTTLEQHIVGCASCRAQLAQLQKWETALRAARPEIVSLDPQTAQRLLVRALAEAERATPPLFRPAWRRRVLAYGLTLGAGAALFALFTQNRPGRKETGSSIAIVRPTTKAAPSTSAIVHSAPEKSKPDAIVKNKLPRLLPHLSRTIRQRTLLTRRHKPHSVPLFAPPRLMARTDLRPHNRPNPQPFTLHQRQQSNFGPALEPLQSKANEAQGLLALAAPALQTDALSRQNAIQNAARTLARAQQTLPLPHLEVRVTLAPTAANAPNAPRSGVTRLAEYTSDGQGSRTWTQENWEEVAGQTRRQRVQSCFFRSGSSALVSVTTTFASREAEARREVAPTRDTMPGHRQNELDPKGE